MTVRRGIVGLLAAAWLAAGLFGAYTYVTRYVAYRGFPAPVTPAGIARGTVREVSFHSGLVSQGARYLVYLPPGYRQQAARGRRYPVLYLLHGVPGKFTAFTDVARIQVIANEMIASHRMPPVILVMPCGQPGTFSDTEWANTTAGRWEDYVLEVVRQVDHRYATIPDRAHRGLAGDSEGAYGAVNIALHHLRTFSVIESWGGYFTQTPTAAFHGATPAQLRANSPTAYVGSLAPAIRRLGLRAWLYQGRTDSADPALMRGFAAQLHAAGADVRIGFFRGGHDWGLFRRQTPRMLVAAARWFARSPRGHAGFSATGHSLPLATLRRMQARRLRHCLTLQPRPGLHIRPGCRRLRAAHGLSDRPRV
jgi:enterochelin esterase-like enzyme